MSRSTDTEVAFLAGWPRDTARSRASAPDLLRGRLLVVDDDLHFARAIARQLGEDGHDVIAVTQAPDALAQLERRPFDLVLCDLNMPQVNGLTFLSQARLRAPHIPVLMMTGAPTVATAAEAMAIGAVRYLIKPFEPSLLRSMVHDVLVRGEAPLRVSFERALGSLWLAYQPIVSHGTRRVIAYEALLRSQSHELAHPGALLDTAERLRRLPELGRAVRGLAAADVARAPAVPLFVNLHAVDLLDEDLYDPASPLGAFASRVVLEITERAALDGVDDIRSRVGQLRSLGYRLAIDDLGAGYASLTSLTLLEPEFVKIDMSLVRGIEAYPAKSRLVRAVVAVSKELGARLVAEGVETAAERDHLVELGCDLQQGFFYARPGLAFPGVTFDE